MFDLKHGQLVRAILFYFISFVTKKWLHFWCQRARHFISVLTVLTTDKSSMDMASVKSNHGGGAGENFLPNITVNAIPSHSIPSHTASDTFSIAHAITMTINITTSYQ